MKKTAWVFKMLIFVLIVILIYFMFRMHFIYSEHKIKNEIIESVSGNIDEFTNYSVKIINEKISSGEFKGFQVQNDPDYPDILNYYYKGKGIGSASIYYGVYYIPDDNVELFFNGQLKKKDSDSWFYQENNSDNTMYLERIIKSFYFYKNTY